MDKIDQKFSRRSKKKLVRKWPRRFSISLIVILIGCTVYFGCSLYGLFSSGYKKMNRSQFREEDIVMEKNPFAILLIGEDGREIGGHNWRPDTLMVATVNPKTNSIKLISIPRDTYTEIANTHGLKTKINAAAHYGYVNNVDPVQNIRETVENLLHIPIDYYVKANFQGFTHSVDLLGGVNVNVDYDFKEKMVGGKSTTFVKGPMHLQGAEALAYVRMRKKDPLGDHGRNKRQQEVLAELINKFVSLNGISRFSELSRVIGQNVTYNIKPTQLPTLSQIYLRSKKNMETIKVNTTPTRLQGICYELLPQQEKLRISSALQQHLGFTPMREYAFTPK